MPVLWPCTAPMVAELYDRQCRAAQIASARSHPTCRSRVALFSPGEISPTKPTRKEKIEKPTPLIRGHIITGYRTYPHIDMADTARRARARTRAHAVRAMVGEVWCGASAPS